MTIRDIRLKRLLEDMIHPSAKQGMSPYSWKYLSIVFKSKKKDILFASFPRSGWNWTGDILSYCLIKKHTGEYAIAWEDGDTYKEAAKHPFRLFTPADSRACNARKLRETFPPIDIDYCFHTHGFWKESPLWGLDQARTIIITRNIPASLFSYYKSKSQKKHFHNFEDFVMDGNLDRAIRYYNSWGEFIQSGKRRVKVFKYEDMRKETEKQFSEMYEFAFGSIIDPEILEEALDFFSFENQKKRELSFCKNENKHFHFQGKLDYTKEIPKKTLQLIHDKLNKNLKHDFGYTYSDWHHQ